ncbi:MAG: formate C-acetyltransferase/glycerol dehydratase family glycyl radical enzyme [bacterium]
MPRSRVERLRERIVDAPQEVCVERALHLTRSMTENWCRHPLTRMSMALAHVLDRARVIIREGELVVGCRTSKLKGAPLFPENKSQWIEGDLESFDRRLLQKALITDEEKRVLRDQVLPFWKGRTVEDRLRELLPADVSRDMDTYVFTMMLEITYGIGHFTMDHPRVLRLGLRGIIDETRTKRAALSGRDRAGDKGFFYDAVIRSLDAAIRFARRHAALAQELAAAESDPARKRELEEISAVCSRVPEHPARTFREAVQSVYFIHLIAQIESGGNSISLGRIDRILLPYYLGDRRSGRTTPEEARELLSLLYLKTNEIWNVLEEAFIPGGEGAEGKTTQNVVVGGVGPDGKDATSELSRIALDAYADLRTVQPNFGVRLSALSPPDFFLKAVQYARDGVALHFFNDDAIIPSLTAAGHALEHARDYGVVGCLEPNAQGRTFGSTFAVQLNAIKCLELALSNGTDTVLGSPAGIRTGDPRTFRAFEDVWTAYAAQVSHFVRQMVRGMAALDQAIAEIVPSPFASAMIEGPLERGLDLTRGGALYNSTGVELIGFANVADSLHAIRTAVFEDRSLTLGQLVEWLANNWREAEDKRVYLLRKIAKYGNDDDEVDGLAARVLDHFCNELSGYRSYRGGAFWPGVFSVGFHIAMGAFTGATPDGRPSGAVLGNGLTPMTGNAFLGPTAVLRSVTKLPLKRVSNGANLNMRFHGKRLRAENLKAFIDTYFERGGLQVQFNMVGADVLRDAQLHPENHRDLVVRVSGYSALFTGLSSAAQEEIVARTEYEL